MALNLDIKGLKSIVNEFELFFIDIWGVLHNGINLFQNSIQVLNELEENQKKYVLLTIAPRPNLDVINFLKRIGLDKRLLKNYYRNIGYYEVDIASSNVEYSEGEGFVLTYSINAGTRYKISKISTNVDSVLDKKLFLPLNEIYKKTVGTYYSPLQ